MLKNISGEKDSIPSADKVWAFDLGKASLGECVRKNDNVLHIASNIIPPDFAEIKTAAGCRRQMRTRTAHKARERWLDKCLKDCGLEILKRRSVEKINGSWRLTSKGDERLEREFPKRGDETCYNSIALRCKLLLGEKLEPWQLYKALNSAMQLRGYDTQVAWKTSKKVENNLDESSNLEDGEDAESKESLVEFNSMLKEMTEDENFRLPAFFKAYQMGLWNPKKPKDIKLKIDCHAGRAAGFTMPRALVEKEFALLIENAAKQYPKLKGKAMYFLYGPSEKAYASFYPECREEFSFKQGAETDWQGVLGQKIPRFDNRIVDKCKLILRLNVCKIKPLKETQNDDERLPQETSLLMKLVNIRLLDLSSNSVRSLKFEEFKKAYMAAKENSYKFTERQWAKFLKGINCEAMAGHEFIEEPSSSGRASFSRPAMRLLKELILSGEAPQDFYAKKIKTIKNKDSSKGLVKEDLDFIKNMGDIPWSGIYLPDMGRSSDANIDENKREAAVLKLIGKQIDPIVRHRLFYFFNRIKLFKAKFGTPDRVVLEFVRDDFLGKKAKADLQKIINTNRTEKLRAAEELSSENMFKNARSKEEKFNDKKLLKKYMLLKAQKFVCLYTGEELTVSNLDSYEIDHILPRSKGGADAQFNLALTTRKNNSEKDDRTPAEWLKSSGKWQSYVARVRANFKALGKRKSNLLTSDNAYELMEKYTALAETAWIAKLSQSVVSLYFGWNMGISEGKRKIFVANGSTTARIRGVYQLNKLLLDSKTLEEIDSAETLTDKIKNEKLVNEKNRKNKKHHALDAFVISFAPDFDKKRKRNEEFDFGGKIGKNPYKFLEKLLGEVMPTEVAFEKPKLGETIYGKRTIGKVSIMTHKVKLRSLPFGGFNGDVYDVDSIAKSAANILDKNIAERVLEFSKTNPAEEEWLKWCDNLYVKNKDGSMGAKVIRVRYKDGDCTEYKDLSKDASGAWRKGKKGHKGQIVWKSKTGKFEVCPIYVHASKEKLVEELKARQDFDSIQGFYQSHCLVKLDKDVADDKGKLLCGKGVYMLNTMLTDGRAKLTSPDGISTNPIGLKYLISSAFRRYYPDKD